MKVLIISGSRNPEGQTARAIGGLVRGVRDAGASAEVVFLPELTIERCRQCDAAGWGLCKEEGRCIIEDDFAGLVNNTRSADAVVFATPVYFSDVSESLRAFLDRLRRVALHEVGKQGISGTRAVGICVAGGGGGGAPTCTFRLEQMLNTCGFDIVDMVPVRRQNLQMKEGILEIVGHWLVDSQA